MNLKSFRNLTLLLLAQVPALSYSQVNMKDGNFHRTWIDGGILSRTYNSRSMYPGLFGFGWCSNLEMRIEIASSEELVLENCGQRTSYIRSAGKNSVYISGEKSLTKEKLSKEKYRYVLKMPGRTATFDALGRLTQLGRGAGEVTLEFDAQGRPLRMRSRRLGSWMLEYSKDQKNIVRFGTSHGREVFYFYGGGNLQHVADSVSAPVSFQYDEFHNLTKISGLSLERVVYDSNRDLVTEFYRADGCSERFQYTANSVANEILETAKADVDCGGVRSTVIHEFIYVQSPKGGALLSRVRSTVNGETRGSRVYLERGPASRTVTKGAS